jgi:hypothetical protein
MLRTSLPLIMGVFTASTPVTRLYAGKAEKPLRARGRYGDLTTPFDKGATVVY